MKFSTPKNKNNQTSTSLHFSYKYRQEYCFIQNIDPHRLVCDLGIKPTKQLKMEGVSFPRGGRERPSEPAEKDSAKKQNSKRKTETPTTLTPTSSDFLFGNSTSDSSKKRKVTTASDNSSSSPSIKKRSLLPLGGGGVVLLHAQGKSTKQEPLIEALSFSKLAKGTKLFGIVREVHEEFAVLSLPNLLTGYLLQEGTLPLTRSVTVGQCLAVAIVKIVTETVTGGQQRRRIQVSAKPSALNSGDAPSRKVSVRGQVVSVEDHGCLIDLGFSRKGFLSFDQIEGDYKVIDVEEENNDEPSEEKGRILQTGRLYDFFVTSSSTDAVFSLSLPSVSTMARHVLVPTTKIPTLSSICPGWLVQAKMESLAKNGLCVTFFGNVYRGAVELAHIGGNFTTNTREVSTVWRDVFTHQQSFTARILAVDVPTKLIRMSILPHLLKMTIPTGLPPVGTTVEDCKVVRMDPGIGALLALPEEYDKEMKMAKPKGLYFEESYLNASKVRAVYVHISKAIDENDSQLFAKDFAPSTSHKVRILGALNWIEGVASGACAPSLVDAHVLTHSDLKPGQIYKQVPVFAQLKGGSILVNLGAGVRGLIPALHLFETSATSEYRRKLLKTKYAVDAKVNVRVLWVNVEKKKCLLTAKKGLVEQDETITSYDDIQLGQKAAGFVSKIDDQGLYVTFCNRVYGRVTARSLAAELGVEDHRQDYHVGDVVSCRVLNRKSRVQHPGDLEEEEDDDEENQKRAYWELTLSLKVQGDNLDEPMEDVDGASSRTPKRVRLKAGAVLPLKSMKIVELVKGKQKEKGGFVPGYAIVSIKSKYLIDEAESATMLPYMECKLPYDQLMDEYTPADIESVEALDSLAERVLTVGKKINQRGIVLTDPHKSNLEYSSGTGTLTVLSIRKKLIETAEKQYSVEDTKPEDIILAAPDTHLFVGAFLQGYVAQVDSRHGCFVRFLEGMTGLIPKTKGGLDLPLYGTVVTRVIAIDDSKRPMKILLKAVLSGSSKKAIKIEKKATKSNKQEVSFSLKPGDKIAEAKITKVDFYRATVQTVDQDLGKNVSLVIHCTMKDSPVTEVVGSKKSKKRPQDTGARDERPILKGHPFYKWKTGMKVSHLTVVSVDKVNLGYVVQLTDRKTEEKCEGDDEAEQQQPLTFVNEKSQLTPGMIVTGIITGVGEGNKGVYLQLSPKVGGFIPVLELSTDVKVLNNLTSSVPVGARLQCCVMDGKQWQEIRSKSSTSGPRGGKSKSNGQDTLYLSTLRGVAEKGEGSKKLSKPSRGDLIVGRVNRSMQQVMAPSLMLDLRGGYVGRCCITELEEVDEWVNMPLGRISESTHKAENRKKKDGSDGDDADRMDADDPEAEADDADERYVSFPEM
jgi:ribosomal protein S1